MPKEIWSFIEKENGKLHDTAPKMASEAKRNSKLFKGVPCGVFFGTSSSVSLLKELEIYGLEKIYLMEGEGHSTPEILADNFCGLASKRSPELMLFAATPLGTELGARVAAKLKKGYIAYCVDFELRQGDLIARKALYEGKACGYFTWYGDPPYVATINLRSLEAVEQDKRKEPEIIKEKFREPGTTTNFLKHWKVPLSELEITEARLVVGIGGGVVNNEFVGIVENLAELLGGVIGGSRVAVFRDYVPAERQVGTTGKFIDADIYMPIGISGSNRHTVAIKNVKHVIPININKEAPIFKFAEIGVVGDLHEVVPSMIEYIKNSDSPWS